MKEYAGRKEFKGGTLQNALHRGHVNTPAALGGVAESLQVRKDEGTRWLRNASWAQRSHPGFTGGGRGTYRSLLLGQA